MRLTVQPGNPLRGEVTPPGDKSISHRAALIAALASGESRVGNFLVAGVTRSMLDALAALGVAWDLDGSTLSVQGAGLVGLRSPAAPIDCGNSATTLRLLAGALAAAGIAAVLDGSPGLRRRPMDRIIEPLRKMGVPVSAENGQAPLVFSSRNTRLEALEYSLPVASAQVKSCLLLAGLAASGPITLTEPEPSRDHTERMLRSLGLSVMSETGNGSLGYTTRLTPPHPFSLPPLRFTLPGDISSAAFLVVAALITPGSQILLRDILLNPTRTGLLEALLAMGADLRISPTGERHGEPLGDILVRASTLRAMQVSGTLVVRMIDEFPAFAVAAAYAHGQTVVSDARELRYKESDRIAAICSELQRLGVNAHETPDGFTISGGGFPRGETSRRALQGGVVASHGDHRLAMALAVAGLASLEPVTVRGAEVLSESFPDFAAVLKSLGAQVEVEHG